MSFDFATSSLIVFGPGKLSELGELLHGRVTRALVITGASGRFKGKVEQEAVRAGIQCHHACAPSEPTVAEASLLALRARQLECHLIIGCGGGAAIDLGKAVAALATSPHEAIDHLEVIGKNRSLESTPLPFIAIPTTAGTGSEVTRNAVLKSPEHRVKASLRSPRMFPSIALIDPELTQDLPKNLTASTGLDALTQTLEPFVCLRSNPVTDGFCREGLSRCAWALRRVCECGSDMTAREAMSVASLMGGLALANSGLGAVHGFAGSIGGMFEAPHGAVCAALLAPVWRTNVRALERHHANHSALDRYKEAAKTLTGQAGATLDDGARWLGELVRDLEIPGLRSWGITDSDLEEVAAKSSKASSMKVNPVNLSMEELRATLLEAM